MDVKPMEFIVRGRRSLTQSAVKCRGPEYLRIIYGPEYSLPENLEPLRSRSISGKRSLALREFALGIEALEFRPKRTAEASARVRLRSPRIGKRASRSSPLGAFTSS